MPINKTTILYDESVNDDTIPHVFPAARIRNIRWSKDIPLLEEEDNSSSNEQTNNGSEENNQDPGETQNDSTPQVDPNRYNC
jgi:hypothetical protein